jgi:hypothetical protein
MGVPVTIQIPAGPGPRDGDRRARTIEVTFTSGPPQIVRAFSVGEAVHEARSRLIARDPFCGRMATYLGAREL